MVFSPQNDSIPLPSRIFQRQVTFGGRARSTEAVSFLDVNTSVMTSLEWKSGQSQRVHPHSTPAAPIPIYSLGRIPSCSRLLVGDESGHLHVLDGWFNPMLLDLEKFPCPVTSIHITDNSAVTSVRGGRDKVLVGSGSGHVSILDLEGKKLLHSFEAHYKAVKKVDSINGDVIVSCGKDNKICVFDLRVKEAKNPVNLVHDAHHSTDGIPGGGTPRSRRRGSNNINHNPLEHPAALSSSVTDFVFLDEHRIISAGSSDGRLKEWDLRLSYKQLTTCHPVQMVEYPSLSNVRGYSCLQLSGSKLFASSVHHEIFQLDVGTMTCEATYLSPSKISNYTKIDLSSDGNYLAVGSDEPLAHIFCTDERRRRRLNVLKKEQGPLTILPFKSLNHEPISSSAVCCPLFSPFDDLMLTTGGDASIVSKWSPNIHLQSSKELEKEGRKRELEKGPLLPIRSEFRRLSPPRNKSPPTSKPVPHPFLTSPCKNSYNFHNKENATDAKSRVKGNGTAPNSSIVRERVCFAKLDSFPNYVIDGMILPHVCPPRIRIKLRPKDDKPFVWAISAEVKQMMMKEQVAPTLLKVQGAKDKTPTRSNSTNRSSSARKRRKFCDEGNSPKILQYFPIMSSTLRMSPSTSSSSAVLNFPTATTSPATKLEVECDSLNSPVASLRIKTDADAESGSSTPPN